MLGSLISAGANLLGGLLGKSSADSAREAQMQMNAQNIALQKEFAQHGIRWKVEDAKAAGIHPIYAIGGSGASFTPVSSNFAADTSLPNALAAAGQDIGRAVNATRTAGERADAFTQTMQRLQLEKAGLENDVLRTQIASATGRLRPNSPGNPPAMPSPGTNYELPGSGETALIEPKKLEVAPAHPAQPQSEGGAITDVGYARTSTGWAPVPSKDVKERIEDSLPQELMHFWRNNILPSVGYNFAPPPFKAPAGKEWHFHIPSQEYRLMPHRSKLGVWERGFTTRDERR